MTGGCLMRINDSSSSHVLVRLRRDPPLSDLTHSFGIGHADDLWLFFYIIWLAEKFGSNKRTCNLMVTKKIFHDNQIGQYISGNNKVC